MTLTIESMNEADIPAVQAIEKEAFEKTWDETAFRTELHHNKSAHYLVARDADKVVGYCGVWLVVDEVHLTAIAIAPEARGRKLGQRLLLALLRYCLERQARWLHLEVRADNEAALSLYKKFGLTRVGVRPNYYQQRHDAVVMAADLQASGYPERLRKLEQELRDS